jgi:hypothetical protein
MSRRPIRISTEMIDKNIRQQRELEEQRRELNAFGAETSNLLSAASAQTKIEQQRRLASQLQSKNEMIAEENFKRQAYDRKMRDLTSMQNQALSTELEKDAAAEERKKREIQKICEEAPELKELEKMLKVAYLNKERSVQYEEKVKLAMREQERIQAIEEEMERDRIRHIQSESNKDQRKRQQYEEQRSVLLKQINERKRLLEEAKIQLERERQMVNEVVNKIQQEDEEEYRIRKEKQIQTAKMVRDFEEQRKRELERSRAEAKAEEDRINSYNRAMEARSEGIEAKKQAKREEDDRILQQIVEETERKRKEEEEFNNLRDMLWEEELEAKRTQDTYERKMKQHRMKEEMMQANSDIKKFKELQRLKDAENEAKLVVLMKTKFAEDEARERSEDEARRRSKLQHMTLIERQKEERKMLYEQERTNEMRSHQEALDREGYRKQVIQEARKRLLEEHAARLRGFLPSKVFDNHQEYEQFR